MDKGVLGKDWAALGEQTASCWAMGSCWASTMGSEGFQWLCHLPLPSPSGEAKKNQTDALHSLKTSLLYKIAKSVFSRPLPRGQKALDSLLGGFLSHYPWCKVGRWWIPSKLLDRLRPESACSLVLGLGWPPILPLSFDSESPHLKYEHLASLQDLKKILFKVTLFSPAIDPGCWDA